MNFIDIHCHLLPNIDDGSKDIERSIEQLKDMESHGVKELYLTSHYFRGHYQYSRDEYDKKVKNLQEAAAEAGISIKLRPGFEVFVQTGIVDDIKEKSLTLGDSDYVLIESELNGLPEDFYANVYPILRAGYKPILAHAERYVSVMKKPSQVRDLIQRNIHIQTNAGALLGLYGEKVRKTAWILIENGWTHFLASDDHVRSDYGFYPKACELLRERVDEYTANLLCYEFPAAIAKNEEVPFTYVKVEKPRTKQRRSFWEKVFG